ncbi:1047_t:CDS:2, partial [Funneliformis geosporum]
PQLTNNELSPEYQNWESQINQITDIQQITNFQARILADIQARRHDKKTAQKSYQENQAEAENLKKEKAAENPSEYSEEAKQKIEKKLKNNGLVEIETKLTQTIYQKGVKRKVADLTSRVNQVLNSKSDKNQIATLKKELLQFISSSNIYYTSHKKEVKSLLTKLENYSTNNQQSNLYRILGVNKELEIKIIDYLKRLEKNEISPPINSKKKGLLLISKSEYEKLDQEQKEYQELSQELSKEEQNLILAEVEGLKEKKAKLINKIKEQIIEEEGISQSVIMEIRPGPGGNEAGLFVRDLYRMGKGVFNYLKNESGVHRVQRIPKTAKGGEIHTSTATVVILPEFQDIKLDISKKNLKIETCRASGAGGQHVNTTDSAVKVTYTYFVNGKTETITATSQDGRSQHDNRERALTVLKDRLLEKLQTDQAKEVGNLRSSMIGSSE